MVSDRVFFKEYVKSRGNLAKACLESLVYAQDLVTKKDIELFEFGFPPEIFGNIYGFKDDPAVNDKVEEMIKSLKCSVHQQMMNLSPVNDDLRRRNLEFVAEGFYYAMQRGLNNHDSIHVLHLVDSPWPGFIARFKSKPVNSPSAGEMSLCELRRMLGKKGFRGRIGLENMTPKEGIFLSPACFNHLADGMTGGVIDVAHLFASGGDPARQIWEFRNNTLAVHLSNTRARQNGVKEVKHCALGKGRVFLPKVLETVERAEKDQGREIRVIAEVGRNDFEPSWDYLKDISYV